MLGQTYKYRWGLRLLVAAIATFASAAAAAPASAANLDEDYARRILDIYKASDEDDDLPNVADRLKGKGIRHGQFWFIPEAESGLLLNSNVRATPGNAIDDLAAYLKSSAKVRSDFGRHAISAEAAVKHVEFSGRSSESHTEAYGKAEARIDIMRGMKAYLDAKGGTFVEERGDIVAPTLSLRPIEYQTVDVGGKIMKNFNRLTISGRARFANYDYDDNRTFGGAVLDQDFRDHRKIQFGGRAKYELIPGYGASLAPGTNAFLDVQYESLDYRLSAVNRDSHGFRVLGGLEFELGRLLYGQAGMGYSYRDYESAAFGAQSSYSFVLGLVWNPTPLMTFNLDAQQRFEDSTLPGISGSDQTYVKLTLDYEVLRRLVVSPSVRMVYDNFNDSSIKGHTLGVGLRAEYEISRFLHVGANYMFTDRNFTGTALDYSRHQAGLFLRARF